MTTPATGAMTDQRRPRQSGGGAPLSEDATRLRIVRALADGPVYGTDLAERLGVPQNLATYHLRRLEAAGLLRRERREHRVYYALDPAAWAAFTAPVRQVCDLLAEVTEAAEPDATG